MSGGGAAGALGFLTVVGRSSTPSGASFAWFPVVGALIGAFVGGVWWVAFEGFSPWVAAAIALAVDAAVTGALHWDGLADSGDGLLPHADRSRRLEIMATPDVGAFGVLVVVLVALLRWSALASCSADVLVVGLLWCGSRSLVALAAVHLPYARTEGLASAFLNDRPAAATVVPALALAAVVIVAFWHCASAGVAVVGLLLAGAGILALALRRLGGFTGDVLGAAIVVGETVGLVVASGRW